MTENEKINIDLEVYNLAHDISTREEEACFYFRLKDKEVKIGYAGYDEQLINAFVTSMKTEKFIYDLLSTAVELFESDSLLVIEGDE